MNEIKNMIVRIKITVSKKLNIFHYFRYFRNRMSKEQITLFVMTFLIPSFAYAADGGMVVTFISNLCSLLSGKIAQGVGVLAIIVMGYRIIKGRMDWHYGAYITIGMGMIMGSAYYGTTVFGS